MLRDKLRVVNRSEWTPVLITGLVCALAIWGATLVESGWLRWLLIVLFGAIAVGVVVSLVAKMKYRYCELCKGHCPNPLCHGVVQHSEYVPRGFVVCPTCKKTWPELKNIVFKTTSRQW